MKKILLILLFIATVLHTQDDEEYIERPEDYFKLTYIVIADSSHNYYAMDSLMIQLSKELNIPIRNSGMLYDPIKVLIRSPYDDPDNIYAGKYWHRRLHSLEMSLEYLYPYIETNLEFPDSTIILVAGMFYKEKEANRLYDRITNKNKFILKTNMYIGCMH